MLAEHRAELLEIRLRDLLRHIERAGVRYIFVPSTEAEVNCGRGADGTLGFAILAAELALEQVKP